MADYIISGITQLQGTPVTGSTIRLYNQDTEEYKGEVTSSVSGAFQFDLTENEAFNQPLVDMVGLEFDGSDDYINVPNSTSMQITGDLTIAFWIYVHQFGSTRRTFIDKAYGGEYTVNLENGDNTLNLYRGTSGANAPDYTGFRSSPIPINTWVHAAVTVSGTNGTWYIDGQQDTTLTDSLLVGSASSNAVRFGLGYTNGYLDGVLSELSFWDRALSAQEVSDLMNQQLCGDETGLNAYYRLDDTSGGTVQDYSQNTNTGTLVSAPFTTTTSIDLTECNGGVSAPYNFHVLCEYTASNGEYQTQSLPYINAVVPPEYTITFTVTDNETTNPIQGATVTIGSTTATTDVNGVATIDRPNGTYSYTITASGYTEVTGQVTVLNGVATVSQSLETAMSVPVISDLKLHYDATTLSLNNLDDVNQWDDISGNGHHLTPISSNPPQYLSQGSSPSSRPSVNYDGNSALRTWNPVMEQPVTYIIAGKLTTAGYLYDGTDNARRHSFWTSDVDTWGMFATTVPDPMYVPNSTGENGIIHITWYSDATRIYFNNVLQHTVNPGSRGTDGFVLGARFSDSSYSNGQFFEVLVYNKVLNSTERTDVYDYLNSKWFN